MLTYYNKKRLNYLVFICKLAPCTKNKSRIDITITLNQPFA